MSQPNPQQYISKHAFTGDVRQAQLSFAPNTIILAKPGQDGAWWWGSCHGKEGWFPPSYVSAAMPSSPSPNVPPSMTVPSSTSLPQPAYGLAQQGPPPLQARPAQPLYEPADPFAGLPTMDGGSGHPPATATMSMANLGSMTSPAPVRVASQSTSVLPPLQTSGSMDSTSGASPTALATPPGRNAPTRSASAQLQQPIQAAVSPTAAALTRLGISPPPSRTSSPTPKRATFSSASSAQVPAIPRARSGSNSSMDRKGLPPVSPRVSPRPSPRASPMTGPKATVPAATASAMPSIPVKQDANPYATVASSTAGMTHSATAPVQMTKQEREAKMAREQDAARQKAAMRQQKQQSVSAKDRAASVAAGLGLSGVTETKLQVTDEQVEVTLPQGSSQLAAATMASVPQRTFSPLHKVPAFWSLLRLSQTYVRQKPVPPELLKDRNGMYAQLEKALNFVCHVCVEVGKLASSKQIAKNPLAFLTPNHTACEACLQLMKVLPHSAGASGAQLDGLFLQFLNVLIPLIEATQDNQQIVLPGGWQTPESTYLCLYILRNCGNNRWSFTVCNTGPEGLQYHPSTFDPETGRELKQLALTVWDIPAVRILDSTFWTLLMRMQVYPSKRNSAVTLYTKLLPALNARPLRSNLDHGPSEWWPTPDLISSQSFHPLAQLALTTTPATGYRTSRYAHLLLQTAAVELAMRQELVPHPSVDPEDARIFQLVGRNVANYASTVSPMTVGDGSLGGTLVETWELLDRLLQQLNARTSKPADQYSHGLEKEQQQDVISTLVTSPGSAAHPLFGRLRRDNYEEVVNSLIGQPRPDPIVIPAVLTDETLPPVASDYSSAGSYLQRVADASSLLLQQRRSVKNAPAFAASAAQHILTHFLPLPHVDPKFCFWRKDPMRRETQVYLLQLLRRIVFSYSASTMSVQPSRGLTAVRSTALAAGACVADALCRVKAIDDPSAFCMHYSGQNEGPTEPFCLSAGAYASLGATLPLYDPALAFLRGACLEYLQRQSQREDGTRRDTVFSFEHYPSALTGDVILVEQLSIQLALPRVGNTALTRENALEMDQNAIKAKRNHATGLISGANGALVEVLPELECLRDIVFSWKHAVSGKALGSSTTGKAAAPADQQKTDFTPSEATLHWGAFKQPVDKQVQSQTLPVIVYSVVAFGKPLEFVAREAQQETSSRSQGKKRFTGFLQLFSAPTKLERSRLSSADATTVVNSCAEAFQKKRYV